MNQDITPDFVPNAYDSKVAENILRFEGTPFAIHYFSNVHLRLTDSAFWFLLSTLWVSNTTGTDLKLWRRLFSSQRPKRRTSIMKPSELELSNRLPDKITAYRAHKEGETDWINYTIDHETAELFARINSGEIVQYSIQKKDVIALFTRRGESEIIMLKPHRGMVIQTPNPPSETGAVVKISLRGRIEDETHHS